MQGGAPSAVSMSLGILGAFPYSVEAVYLTLDQQECGRRIAHQWLCMDQVESDPELERYSKLWETRLDTMYNVILFEHLSQARSSRKQGFGEYMAKNPCVSQTHDSYFRTRLAWDKQ